MPSWAGKWKGGRFYLDADGRQVFFIERMVGGSRYQLRLKTHDPDLALGDLSRFLQDPVAFSAPPPAPEAAPGGVYITKERLNLFMDSIHDRVKDYRTAKAKDLHAWSEYRDAAGKGLDLATVDKRALRVALASFKPPPGDKRKTGAFKRRAESLNCFANFLVSEGDLKTWSALGITSAQKPPATRAERMAYTAAEVRAAWLAIEDQRIRDVIHLRAVLGMHDTEIQQLRGARLFKGPLPDRGAGIRTDLGKEHEIKGVLQFRQKTKPRHRASADGPALAAALRLSECKRIPTRFDTYNACVGVGIIPSNLRHTFTTMRGVGKIVHFEEGGVSLDEVAEILGHRVGSSMTSSRYDKLQVPPMMKLALDFNV